MIDMVMHEQLLAISTYAQSGAVINAALNPSDEAVKTEAIKRLKDFGSVNTYSINIGVADINGNIILDNANPKLEGVSIASVHPELFNRMKANNYNYTYDNATSVSSTTGGQALLLCGGLKNSAKGLIGIIYINLDLAKVNNDFIGNLNVNGRITVANNDGNVILSSDKERIGEKLPDVYSVIKTSHTGIIESYDNEGH